MATNQQSDYLTYTHSTLPPALLFTGQKDQTLATVEQLLQKTLCHSLGCNTCITCMQIRNKQHHAIMWLAPEKNYTIDQFDDVFAALSLQLQTNELFFFIIQKTDFLTTACANKLLKPMEEPPTGYHFILLAEHPEQIVPTIKSRCITHMLTRTAIPTISHPLFEVFTKKDTISINEFAKILDACNINERESIELFDQILNHWFTQYHQKKDEDTVKLITRLQKIQAQPPMPGSSITFWRNIYLQIYS